MSELRIGPPVSLHGFSIIPLERVFTASFVEGNSFWLHAGKEPAAVVVCSRDSVLAFDTEGHHLELDALLRRTPYLGRVLERHGVPRPPVPDPAV